MKRILQILITLAILFVTIGLLLNKKVQVTQVKTIHYPITEVFDQVNNLKSWANWNFWQQKDAEIEIKYGEIYEGLGAEYSWGSQKSSIGSGSLWITESIQNKVIEYTEDFGGKGNGDGVVTFQNISNESTKIIWSFESEVEGLLGGWFALMMKKMVKKSFKKSLGNLELYLTENSELEKTHLHLEE
jgi:hypothetical protein